MLPISLAFVKHRSNHPPPAPTPIKIGLIIKVADAETLGPLLCLMPETPLVQADSSVPGLRQPVRFRPFNPQTAVTSS